MMDDICSVAAALPSTIRGWPRMAAMGSRSVSDVMVLPVERTHMVALVGASPLRRCATAGLTAALQPSWTQAVSSTLPAGPVRGTVKPSGMS